jgi:hypothetical protein
MLSSISCVKTVLVLSLMAVFAASGEQFAAELPSAAAAPYYSGGESAGHLLWQGRNK